MLATGQGLAGPQRKKVFLVDDHPLVRMGLTNIINQEPDLAVCGEADGEGNVVQCVQGLQPDVAVVDWSLKDKDATELIANFRQHLPQMPVLVLSMHEELFYAERALRAGAQGFIMKQEATDKIIEAVRTVIAGQSYLSSRMAHVANLEAHEGSAGRNAPLTAPDTAAQPVAGAATPDGQLKAALRLSIVIPVYNSETTIGKLCEQLLLELNPCYHVQLILVDDSSSDRSAEICQKLHDQHPEQVDCLVLSRNFGEHNAVMAGLNCVDGDYCVIMDDDFQNPPSEVRKLVDEIVKGHDVVYVRYDAKRHSPYRNLGSRLHNWMATRALGKPADLYLSSFKIISRFLMQEIVRYTGPDPYIDAIILRTTRKIGVVSTLHAPRHAGRSGYNFRKLVALWGNMMVSFSLFPLRLLGALGVIMLLLGAGIGLYTLCALLVPSWQDPDSLERLNATNWFFRGVTLVAVGIVGEYVGRIYMHLNRDPQFIIRRITRHRL